MTEFLDWVLRVVDIPQEGLAGDRTASDAERAAIAAELDLRSLLRLSAPYRVTRLRQGGYRLQGEIHADVEQTCIVTLEPLHSRLDEPFDVELCADAPNAPESTEQTILDAPNIEEFDGSRIPLGRVVFETLSAAIDPYPRKPGAEFTWRDERDSIAEERGPFSVLSTLKGRG